MAWSELRAPDGQNRTGGLSKGSLGDTAKQGMTQPTASMSTHHDHVTTVSRRGF